MKNNLALRENEIVVSDLIRQRPIWFVGVNHSEAFMGAFYAWPGPKKSKGIQIAVMDIM